VWRRTCTRGWAWIFDDLLPVFKRNAEISVLVSPLMSSWSIFWSEQFLDLPQCRSEQEPMLIPIRPCPAPVTDQHVVFKYHQIKRPSQDTLTLTSSTSLQKFFAVA
jgi:hypothetical protein